MKFSAEVSQGGGGDYISFKNTPVVQGVLRGDPYEYYQHWKDGKPVRCAGDNCEHCRAGVKRKFSFKINMVMNEGGKMIPKILDTGAMVYSQLRALQEGGWDLEKTAVKISRTGSGMDTEYTVVPVPGGPLNPKVLAQISSATLHDLNPDPNKPEVEYRDTDQPTMREEDVPF